MILSGARFSSTGVALSYKACQCQNWQTDAIYDSEYRPQEHGSTNANAPAQLMDGFSELLQTHVCRFSAEGNLDVSHKTLGM